MKVFVFWLALTLLPAIALATAGPSLATSCFAGGVDGICSSTSNCDSSANNWYNIYSPGMVCYGSGGGCCTPKVVTSGGGPSPLCGTGVDLNLGVNTAIGCLMAGDPKQLVSQLLGWGVGVGGGIAFLMIIFAGFQMATASGDPKRVKAAQELLTSALAGLILIVLSVVLLNFIGVNILGLNNLGFSL